MAYSNFPEVYHAQGISKAAFSGGDRVRMRRKYRHNIWGVIPAEKPQGPQDMADDVPGPAERVRKIRNNLFSDLSVKRE